MTSTSTARAAALAFLTAFSILLIQVLAHRMVSAKLLNNYAFFIISLTMLGFALSGTILTRWLRAFTENLPVAINVCAALFAVSIICVSAGFYRADLGGFFGFFSFKSSLEFVLWVPVALLFTIPFMFSGLIIGTLLAAPGLPTSRIYFADLAGSALGAFAVIPAIRHLGVETAVALAAALLVAGTLVLLPPSGAAARALAAATLAASLGAAALPNRVFVMAYPEGSRLRIATDAGPPYGVEYLRWDPLSRIELSRIPVPRPEARHFSLIGGNLAFHRRFEKMITQNNYAYTYAVNYDGNPASLAGIEETIYASAYAVTSVKRPRVLVIGVGGGFDVLTGIFFDAASITGVEINDATMHILTRSHREYFKTWVDDRRVRLVVEEGRHYLTINDARYDIIQLSGVDSYSGTPGAANVFSESYLYTAEALDLYLRRLTDDGILCLMRIEHRVPREMFKVLTTGVAALRRAGVTDPRRHVIMVSEQGGAFVSMLVKKTPFTEAEVARASAWATPGRHLAIAAAPGRAGAPHPYQSFLALDAPDAESWYITAYPYDIGPVDDDRPFFFRFSQWPHLFIDRAREGLVLPIMEASIAVLLLLTGLVALVCVAGPLLMLSRRGLRTRGAWRHGTLFAAVGVGYMAVEIALLQKFGLLLGHPNYSLSVVLAALLFSSGLGALWSGPIARAVGGLHRVSLLIAGFLLLEHSLVFPHLLAMVGFPFWTKVLIVTGLVFPTGLCLGVFVPTALDQIKKGDGAFVPWAWGVNGIFSVIAPIVGAGVSMTWGINALLLSAIPIYLVAGFVLPAEPGV